MNDQQFEDYKLIVQMNLDLFIDSLFRRLELMKSAIHNAPEPGEEISPVAPMVEIDLQELREAEEQLQQDFEKLCSAAFWKPVKT